MNPAVLTTDLALPVRRGKVRDVYDLGETLLLVSTDRISAFDWVMGRGVPDKGRVLTQLAAFWFARLNVPHHLLSTDLAAMPLPSDADRAMLSGRTSWVRKTEVVPIECVVRGYLSGSAWKEYQMHESVCGVPLPPGLQESVRLPEPIFTPATKEESGHDVNISFAEMERRIGPDLSARLRDFSLGIYQRGAEHAAAQGILIADTKVEFGLFGGQPILIDEVLTPDSSRFWPADQYRPGQPQPSFDKQYVRDYLQTTGWDKNSPPPHLPDSIINGARAKYLQAYECLTGHVLEE